MRSLRLLGEKPIGGTLSAGEETVYLADLNSMLESWSLERLLCYQLVQESKALTTGTGTYTIGSGGAFNTTRPTKIVDPCFILDSGNVKYMLEIIDAEAYGRLNPALTGNSYPQYLFYDQAFVASLATIKLYPNPSASLTLYINSWQQLQSFATISTTMVLPPGYERAIVYNFAIEVAGGFISIQPEVARIAVESKRAIKGVNLPADVMQMPAGVSGRGRHSSVILGY